MKAINCVCGEGDLRSCIDSSRSEVGLFLASKEDSVYSFDSLHKGMILIGCLVFPAAKPPPAEDVDAGQFGLNEFENLVSVQKWSRVAVFKAFVPN